MVEASGNPKTPQFATGALGAPKANITNKSVTYEWSGRPDSNWRPPAPKAVFGVSVKRLVFNYLRFKQMARPCCNLRSLVEPGGFRQLHFYLQSVQDHSGSAQHSVRYRQVSRTPRTLSVRAY